MQATVHTTWFGIDRIKLALVAAGVLVSSIAVTSTISLTDVGGDEANSRAQDVAVVEPAHRPTDRGAGLAWQHNVSWASNGTEALEANGLPIAPHTAADSSLDRADQLAQFFEAKLARQAALEAPAWDHATWTASPGHAGFIDLSTSRLDRRTQMERFYVAKNARQDALELEASTLAERTAQSEVMRRYFAHKEAQIDARP